MGAATTRSLAVLFAAATLVWGVRAQEQKPAEPAAPPTPAPAAAPAEHPEAGHPLIRTSIDEVIVPVTVTDEKGRFISDLVKSDFKVYDEEVPQQITYFSREQNQPVVVGFLVDTSNSSRLYWKQYEDALEELILALMGSTGNDPRFSGFLISYNNEAELVVNTTTDPELLLDKARKLKPGGGAALYDAIYMACTSRSLVKGEPLEPRRVLVIIGDGHDSASKKSLREVSELAQRNLFTIYGVSTSAWGFVRDGDANLTELAQLTGGRVEYPLEDVYADVAGYISKPQDAGNYALTVASGAYATQISNKIIETVGAVAGEVNTQYVLRYRPQNLDENKIYRKIRVEVDLPNVKVRAREGYYPFPP